MLMNGKEGGHMKKLIALQLLSALLVSLFAHAPVKASSYGIFSILGPVVAVPVGTVSGVLRGGIAGGVHHADTVSDGLGNGVIGKVIGTPIGLTTGFVTGGLFGGLSGVMTGITKGLDDPFSTTSMSLDGDFIDYDAYSIMQ
jgi:hypothetical protein